MSNKEDQYESVTQQEFYRDVPHYKAVIITDVRNNDGSTYVDIVLHCDKCGGDRVFKRVQNTNQFNRLVVEDIYWDGLESGHAFNRYICRNCSSYVKLYALAFENSDKGEFICVKIGELPKHDFKAPSTFMSFIGKNRELYFKGKTCELQGCGVGAFAYYRRLVEYQKNSLFDKIIQVAKQQKMSQDFVSSLESAKSESQFIKTKDIVNKVWPEALNLGGQNPMYLLYSLLSEGVHELSDDECLSKAHDIRLVLFALCDRLEALTKDSAHLESVVKRLTGGT